MGRIKKIARFRVRNEELTSKYWEKGEKKC